MLGGAEQVTWSWVMNLWHMCASQTGNLVLGIVMKQSRRLRAVSSTYVQSHRLRVVSSAQILTVKQLSLSALGFWFKGEKKPRKSH